MCDECVELDKKIERYRKVSSFTVDPLAIAALKKQIADLEAQKAALYATKAISPRQFENYGSTAALQVLQRKSGPYGF
jgi:hypothetical protein